MTRQTRKDKALSKKIAESKIEYVSDDVKKEQENQ